MARRRKLNDRAARHDTAYRRAKQENFAARAIYKLEEIDKRFRVIKPRASVLDLGCWPGSWMQYAATRVGPEGHVFGIDLRPVELALPGWVAHEVADVNDWSPEGAIAAAGRRFDVVLSDMAPQTTGDRASDQWRSEALLLRALELARAALRPGGHFVGKVFQAGRFPELLGELRASFQEAKAYQAKHTRAGSSEQYLIGRGLRINIAAEQARDRASAHDRADESD
ncbi:MAG: RlmE family RNA methyltransferase [Myxococcales bacterium]|nr:RlmE family RNA methyltransferase [Myxococcales bacterium]MCB9752284.1 RlmE family RNA methyltransferase [Myxococcales bacterium]